MIWFNGFPFLDNKEDHVFNVPVSRVMTSSPLYLPASDLTVREAEHLLNDNKFQGFPIVEDRASKILVGYIGRTELRYAISKARRVQPLAPNAKCIFTHEAAAATTRTQGRRSMSTTHLQAAPQTFDELESTTGSTTVDFTPYVDHTPISVHPRLPLETVMELFKKMGPRVILVEQRGRLMGLVTVKDCLKYQFKVEAQENATIAANGPSSSWSSANGHGENQESVPTLEEKVWSFLQKIGKPLRGLGNRSIRLEESSAHRRNDHSVDNTSGGHQSRVLDGTEEDDTVELEDQDR
jgi:chloride channel 3/4/5